MHESQRHRAILERLAEKGIMTVAELTRVLGASPATVRRDLARLAAQNQVTKVHGGAEAVRPGARPRLSASTFEGSANVNLERKRRIARAAVGLCRDGESLVVNGGTTTFRMAEFMGGRQLHVLTNSFALAGQMMVHPGIRVLVPGGEIYRDQNIILSAYEHDTVIDRFYAAKMFTGAQAIRAQGLIEADPLLIKAEQKLLEQAEELIVLVDSSKFAPAGSLILCPLVRIHRLVTDDGIPDEARAMLERAGVEVVIAPALDVAPARAA